MRILKVKYWLGAKIQERLKFVKSPNDDEEIKSIMYKIKVLTREELIAEINQFSA